MPVKPLEKNQSFCISPTYPNFPKSVLLPDYAFHFGLGHKTLRNLGVRNMKDSLK